MQSVTPFDSIQDSELIAQAPPLIAWKLGAVNSSEEVAAFMYRGGPKSPTASVAKPGAPDPRPDRKYWVYVKAEMRTFLCSDESRYKELWAKIHALKDKSGTAIVGLIATYLASTLGAAATLLTGFVAVCLYAFIKIGKEAYCRFSDDDTG